MTNVIKMPARPHVAQLQCSACGAPGEGSCSCGAPYLAAGARAAAAVAANPEKSDYAIAEEIGVHKNTVARARESVSPKGLTGPVKRVGRDGKTYPATRRSRPRTNTHQQQPEQAMTFAQTMPTTTPVMSTTKPTPVIIPRVQPRPNSPLYGRPRADEVLGIFRDKNTRTILFQAFRKGAKGASEFWQMILDAIDAGFCTPNDAAMRKPSLRLLFTNAPIDNLGYFNRFDLSNPHQRRLVLQNVWPAAMHFRDRLIPDPYRLEQCVADYWAVRDLQQKEQAVAAVVASPAWRGRTLAHREEEIVVYGQHLWPEAPGENIHFSFDQVRAAALYFRDLLQLAQLTSEGRALSAASLAPMLRFTTRALSRFVDPAVITLVHSIVYAMTQNPTGECKWPAHPHGGQF